MMQTSQVQCLAFLMFLSHSKSFFTEDKMSFTKFSFSNNLLHSQKTRNLVNFLEDYHKRQ